MIITIINRISNTIYKIRIFMRLALLINFTVRGYLKINFEESVKQVNGMVRHPLYSRFFVNVLKCSYSLPEILR